MTITILAVGKQHEPHIVEAVRLYESRLQRFCKLEWILLPHAGNNDAAHAKKAESEAILNKLRPDDIVVLLDERGQQMTSPQLAEKVNEWQTTVRGRLVFIIGGAFGVDETVRTSVVAWSLSKLVFPHQLVRVMLLEQLYRAYAILNGLPYHHS